MERLPDQLPPADAASALDPGSGPWPGRCEWPGSHAAAALNVLFLHLRIFAGGHVEDPLQTCQACGQDSGIEAGLDGFRFAVWHLAFQPKSTNNLPTPAHPQSPFLKT